MRAVSLRCWSKTLRKKSADVLTAVLLEFLIISLRVYVWGWGGVGGGVLLMLMVAGLLFFFVCFFNIYNI